MAGGLASGLNGELAGGLAGGLPDGRALTTPLSLKPPYHPKGGLIGIGDALYYGGHSAGLHI